MGKKSFYVNLATPELKKVLKNMERYDTETQAKLRTAVRTATSDVLKGSMRRAPIRTGKIKANITMEYDSTKNTGIVKAKSPHAHLIEYGHAGPTPASKRTPEHPFMRPAFEQAKPGLIKAVDSAVKP
ncbi:hypothetical protein SOV_50880 [Sporomusa ovata DSM 2662]|uniref:Phage protein, HK97 gp10 family n=1 Tax=Sporomusa ovata TaxID=2378 RepID=A0A0U1L189_9FIRM|nr:HK97-gp10 family putative phage morphogenesis protein [Sporomusa ovata]EQB27461.1 phage protein, HK97 gp10 family [Sporomusa ovata DSM 2662]CQR73305.1 hypothetical protein SpAn4DRAFT_2537 [Sporomusa ovata]